jgi:transcriptional regulator with GAF, ATPase, and Fis domain
MDFRPGASPDRGRPAEPPASWDAAVKKAIEEALVAASGRIEGAKGAAALLGVNPHTLRARMRKLGIDWARFRGASDPLSARYLS